MTGRVYSLVDPDGVNRYIGSTEQELSQRMQLLTLHCLKLEHDCTASPLLRYVSQHGGFEGWTIREVVAITYDPVVRPDALRDAETSTITALRRAGHPLLNKNLPKCQSADRREYTDAPITDTTNGPISVHIRHTRVCLMWHLFAAEPPRRLPQWQGRRLVRIAPVCRCLHSILFSTPFVPTTPFLQSCMVLPGFACWWPSFAWPVCCNAAPRRLP